MVGEKRNSGLKDLLTSLNTHEKSVPDIIERSRQIVSKWYELGLDEKHPGFLTILGIHSQTDHLPKGRERDQWDRQALIQADLESAEIQEDFADAFVNACRKIEYYVARKSRKN